MTLDRMPDNATLLRLAAERTGRKPVVVAYKGIHLDAAPTAEVVQRLMAPEPITLRIPWSCLVSDNAKLRAARRGESATVVLTPEYRAARDRIAAMAKETMDGRPPMDGPLSLVARVWVPDNRRRDVVNFSKALHDALSKVVFQDDAQLHDVRWIRAGVDIDAPRCELTITPQP